MALLTKDTFLAQLVCDVAEDCPICYEPRKDTVTTACKHTFCLECLRHWLTTANTCPCCRIKLYDDRPPSRPAGIGPPIFRFI